MTASLGGVTASSAREEFLNLLIAQLKGQNPLDPVSDTEFIAQLAQFSTLEGIENLNASFEQMLRIQQLTNGSELIGKVAVYYDPDGKQLREGVVTALRVDENRVTLEIDGHVVDLANVKEIRLPD